jgi:hypothetical protein
MKKLFGILIAAGFLASCSTTHPLTATGNPIGDKVGTSSNGCLGYTPSTLPSASAAGEGFVYISGGLCFNNNDYGVIDAAKNGGIDKVATVDLKVTNFILFHKYELIVTGE